MAQDETLALRIRELIEPSGDITEKRMFGGQAFLARGNLALAASGQGGLLVRVDPAEAEGLVRAEGVSHMEMRGTAVAGWIRVESSAVETADQLEPWVERALARARSLPAKPR